MADNQEEKIKNILWGSGFDINKAAELLEMSRQTFYNNIRKQPLSPGFITKCKEVLSIDLDKMVKLETKKPDQSDQAEVDFLKSEVERLTKEVISLQKELLEFYKKK